MTRRAVWLLLLALGCAHRPAPLVFMTDFGAVDDSVAICKGVMLSVEPRLRIVDLTHDVRPYAIAEAARFLADTAPFYPPGSVFVAVIDPGVGGGRRAIVARSRRGQYFVGPDNGLLTVLAERDGLDGVRQITNPRWLRDGVPSATFHGRDVFAPVGARLARGEDWRTVGPPVADLIRIDIPAARLDARGVAGDVIALDGPYGNLVTDVGADALAELGYHAGERLAVRIGARELSLPLVRTFGDVPVGQPLAYVDSRGRLAFAINQGSFSAAYGVTPPAPIFIGRKAGSRPD
jgi:hypothetical protein